MVCLHPPRPSVEEILRLAISRPARIAALASIRGERGMAQEEVNEQASAPGVVDPWGDMDRAVGIWAYQRIALGEPERGLRVSS